MTNINKDKNFSKVYHLIVDNGVLVHMSRKDVMVYLVLNRFANYDTGIAFPSVKKISGLSGVSKNDIHKVVERLKAMGLILTLQGGKEKSFSKYYGIVKRDWIDSSAALKATAKPKRSTKVAVRGKDGRFIPTPQNAEQGSPENADREIPENTDVAVPQTGDIITVDAEKNKREGIEIINRDRGIDEKQVTPDVEKGTLRVDIREYAAKYGFDKAMKLMHSTGGCKLQTAEEFEKQEQERVRRANEYFGRGK